MLLFLCDCSIENLCRDIFLRLKMDEEGFIPLTVIAGFNRVSVLHSECCSTSRLQ